MGIKQDLQLLLGRVSPKSMAKLMFKHAFGRPLDLDSPQDINEKIQWLKFNTDTSEWTRLADKYVVREFIKERGYEETLVKLYGKWDNPEDIDFDSLPNQFILKTNNGTGDVVIVRDKDCIDRQAIVAQLRKDLKSKITYMMGEPHYGRIKPCIIAEELLDITKQPIKSSSLIDYKIWSFDGKPYCIWACFNRTHHSTEVATYDLDWNYMLEASVFTEHYTEANQQVPKPQSLDRLLKMAADLSKGFPLVRVDLYEVNGKPYFGEMTFSPAGGFNNFYTQEFLLELGKQCKLPINCNKCNSGGGK